MSYKQNRKQIARTYNNYDLIFVLGWQNTIAMPYLDKKKTLVGLHSHQSFDKRRTTPENDVAIPEYLASVLSRFKAVNVVSLRLQRLLTQAGIRSTYTPNGVDAEIFYPPDVPEKQLTVCTASASKNDWNKGVNEIIVPACEKLNVPVVYAGASKLVQQQNMRSFYCQANCYVCASKSEGMSLSILEAAACGCVVVTTRCGNSAEFIKDGQNGFFIDRNINSLIEKLRTLSLQPDMRDKMAKTMCQEITTHWTWEQRAKAWIDFITQNL